MIVRAFIVLVLLLFPVTHAGAEEHRGGPKEVIIVGGNSAYPPYEFLDKDGNPTGFVVELTQAIADAMGFEVKIRLGQSWTDMRKALEDGNVDVLQGISFSADREKILDFSPPHSFVSHSIFARKGAPKVYTLDELQGKDVIVMGRGVMHDYFVQAGLQIQPVPAPTVADAIKLLASGQYDYAVVATLPGMYIINDLGIKNVEIVAKGIDTKKYCYAVKKGNLAMLARFNEGFALLKHTGQYRQLRDKWLGDADTSFDLWKWLARYSGAIVLSLVLGLGISIAWSRTLKLQVSLRTAALEREIEERKHAVEDLKVQQQQLIQAGKMAALGVLVSGMAHEINNPNGLILLNLPVIADVIKDIDPILDAHYREQGDFKIAGLTYSRMRRELPYLIDETQEAAKRIKRIVDDLKHFSRKSDADFKELVDLNNVVRTSLRLVDNSLRRSTKNYKVHYADPLPKVKGNTHRLEQVIVNLILNSCQALDGTNKGIFVSTAYDREINSVLVQVHDEGVGIPPEHIPRLTDPFFTTKRDTGGTGLGLAISAEIIKDHGGSIQFDSSAGKGTTVKVILPATTAEARA